MSKIIPFNKFYKLFNLISITLITLSLILLIFAAILILTNSKKNLIFFYTPTELLESEINLKTKIRIVIIILPWLMKLW